MTEEELKKLFNAARNQDPIIPAKSVLDSAAISGNSFIATLSRWLKPLGIAAGIVFVSVLCYRGMTKTSSEITSAKNDSLQSANLQTSTNNSLSSSSNTTDDSLNNLNTLTPVTQIESSIYNRPYNSGNSNSNNYSKNNTPKDTLKGDLQKLYALTSKPSEYHTINCDKDTVLIASEGSRFFIESNSFSDSSGKIITGKITFEVKECYSTSDFLREGLSTATKDGEMYLETGGMFYMQASKNNSKLALREGYEIGFTPNYETPDRMNLYYGERDTQNNIAWELDKVGKIPSPVLIAMRGRYGGVLNPWFYKNYRLQKETMLALYDTTWLTHFTSYFGKIYGNRSCSDQTGAFLVACESFNRQIAPQLVTLPEIKPVSFMSEFTFRGMSKNQYAFAHDKGFIDSFKNYLAPAFTRYVDVPQFFPRTLGWCNIDCVPRDMLKQWNDYQALPKSKLTFSIPNKLQVKAYLYMPAYRSVATSVNTSGDLVFENIPDNHEAYLVITSLKDDVFYMYKKEFNTNSYKEITLELEQTDDAETYLAWLQNALPKSTQAL